jgi:DUF1365 family protein
VGQPSFDHSLDEGRGEKGKRQRHAIERAIFFLRVAMDAMVQLESPFRLSGVWYFDHAGGFHRVDKFERDMGLLKEH